MRYTGVGRDFYYRTAVEENNINKKLSKEYRKKYLDLRAMLRKYQKETGIEFPEDIKKAIGLKSPPEALQGR